VSPDFVSHSLPTLAMRVHLIYFALACIIAMSGVCVLTLATLRSRDRLLLWVGVFSVLYAIRLLAQNELVREAFHVPSSVYIPLALSITYAINIPFALFARELLGRGWRGTIAVWTWLCTGFAVIAISSLMFTQQRGWADFPNGVVVVAGTVVILLHVLRARHDRHPLASSLLWPLLFFGTSILLENEGFRVGGLSIEPVGFLVLLTGLGSVAVRRALRTERELRDVQQELSMARRIQFSILPQDPPDFAGVQIAMRYEPMTSVAGDFYDFLSSDDLLTLLVADVSGHGVPAALVACMLKVCFASQKSNAASPAAILSGLGQMLRGNLGGQYVTAACATINRKSQTITYAGAGHPPSFLIRGNGSDAVLLEENGLFLGPFPHASYKDMTVPFTSGDRLLLYTDGITEARNQSGEEFGRERLQQFLMEAQGSEPSSTLDRLFKQITTGNPEDDLTAVLLAFQ
jgi:phosphoserine phosphatase RsbU/P